MLNRATYQGRFVKDATIVEKEKKDEIEKSAFFSLAVSRDYKVNGKTKVDFIYCEAYKSTAKNIAKYFRKGMLVCVDGTTIGKMDSQGKYINVCRVDKIYFGSDKGNVSQSTNKDESYNTQEEYVAPSHPENEGVEQKKKEKVKIVKKAITEDDIPF